MTFLSFVVEPESVSIIPIAEEYSLTEIGNMFYVRSVPFPPERRNSSRRFWVRNAGPEIEPSLRRRLITRVPCRSLRPPAEGASIAQRADAQAPRGADEAGGHMAEFPGLFQDIAKRRRERPAELRERLGRND